MPIAEENLAAASKIAVARLRSLGGNQCPMALAFPGKVGASPMPSSKRANRNPQTPVASAAANEARLQISAPTLAIVRTPNRSSNTPEGT